jgi:ATPase subunit of ABC transporter with duplicated ATPase domains
MISLFLKSYWKQLLIMSMLAALVTGGIIAWHVHGSTQYEAGYAQAQADAKAAIAREKKQNEKDKETNEREAQQRIDQARNDALDAASRAERLQQQLVAIRKQLGQYNHSLGVGPSAADTGILLADVLSQSLERNRQLAEYADRAAEAGRTCERQYDALTKRDTFTR